MESNEETAQVPEEKTECDAYLRSLLKQDKKRRGIMSTEAELRAHASRCRCHIPRHISGAQQ